MSTKTKSFDEAMDRLNEVVRLLDNPELKLEESIALFEEGLQLSGQCSKQLKQFEKKINHIVNEHGSQEDGNDDTPTT